MKSLMQRHPVLFAFALVLPQVRFPPCNKLYFYDRVRSDFPVDVGTYMLRILLPVLRRGTVGCCQQVMDSQSGSSHSCNI